jgi:hypothetical protein
MADYRDTRNIEASLIEFIRQKLIDDEWEGVSVVKNFNQAYEQKVPVISIEEDNNTPTRKEIGSTDLRNYYAIYINIFAGDGGIKKDLSDWLVETLKSGCPYYQYSNGGRDKDSVVGKIEVWKYTANRNVNLGEVASVHDKHRRFISLLVYIAGKS